MASNASQRIEQKHERRREGGEGERLPSFTEEGRTTRHVKRKTDGGGGEREEGKRRQRGKGGNRG